LPSLATVIYNLFIILGGWFLFAWIGISGFAVGVLTGAIVGNLALQIYGAVRVGARFRPNLNLRHPGFILFIKMAVPIMLALSLSACDDWIVRWFGSYLQPASITWLSYAKTLMRVPLTAIGQAVGVASFPLLTQLYSEGKFDDLNHLLNSTVKGLLLLIVPISALTIAQSSTIVYFVFTHTRLHGPDFQATGYSLAIFSFAMFAWGAQYIFSRGFYATHNTWTPALVGTGIMLLSLPLYAVLVHRWQYIGLALASSIAIIFYMLVLFLLLNRHTGNHEASRVMMFFAKISLASAVAGVVCFRLTLWLQQRVPWQTRPGALLLLVLVSTVGVTLTAGMAKLLGITELDAYFRRFAAKRFA
jgi:putative peptidoglycan lipid II flippase